MAELGESLTHHDIHYTKQQDRIVAGLKKGAGSSLLARPMTSETEFSTTSDEASVVGSSTTTKAQHETFHDEPLPSLRRSITGSSSTRKLVVAPSLQQPQSSVGSTATTSTTTSSTRRMSGNLMEAKPGSLPKYRHPSCEEITSLMMNRQNNHHAHPSQSTSMASLPVTPSSPAAERKRLLLRMNGLRRIPSSPRRFSQDGASPFGDHAHTSATVPPPSFVDIVLTSDLLLQEVRASMALRKTQEAILQQSIRVHDDRAHARFLSGNRAGALISVKRTLKLEARQSQLEEAIRYLKSVEKEIVRIADKATQISSSLDGIDHDRGTSNKEAHSFLSTKHLSLSVDLAQFSNISEDVEKILSRENDSLANSRVAYSEEDLLERLRYASF